MFNFTSMMMTLLFFDPLSSQEPGLCQKNLHFCHNDELIFKKSSRLQNQYIDNLETAQVATIIARWHPNHQFYSWHVDGIEIRRLISISIESI